MIINDLPPEILGQIFVQATILQPIGRNTHKGFLIRRSHKWAPLNFVHVCRYWREVALSMQTLWSSFSADEFKPDALTHWLSFARSSSLHLAYWLGERSEWGQPVEEKIVKDAKEMLHQFSLCADRWDSLYFRVQNFELTEALGTMLAATASRSPLRKFEIHMAHDDTPPKVIDTLTSAIASFPSLRYLSWTFNSIRSSLPRVFPWHVLEHVYVRGNIEVEEFMWCLMECTSARNVTFLGIGRDNKRTVTDAFTSVHCILPALESLTMNEYCDPYRILQHFTLPSLVYLEVQTVYGPSTALQDFLVRSQCPLQTFYLEVADMKKEDVIGCLLTPYLRSVPDVIVFLYVKSERYLADLVQRRPDILRNLPKLNAWRDRTGYNIGWKRSSGKVLKH